MNEPKTETFYFHVRGMVCYSCVGIIESVARRCEGVSEAAVNYLSEYLEVTADGRFQEQQLIEAADKRGYRLTKAGSRHPRFIARDDLKTDRNRILVSFALSVSLWLSVLLHAGAWLQLVIATAIQVISGGQFYRDAYQAVLSRTPNMSLLVAIGSVSTYLFSLFSVLTGAGKSFFEATGTVLVFLLIGKYLERSAKIASSRSVESLLDVLQATATRIRDGSVETVSVTEVQPGDRILVPGNCLIPIDGTIVSGRSEVDESNLTGESRPVPKAEGDHIFCGTVNYNHVLEVTADCVHGDSLYARMITALIRGMDGKRMRIQRITDRICAGFIPAVLGIAVLTLCVWYALLRPGDLYAAVSAAVSVLVAACPCALGIAVPLAVTEAVGILGSSGIIVKNPAALEALSQADIVAFDKTGTLTHGRDDALRDGAPVTVVSLEKLGIRPLVLSGDASERVNAVADACGIEERHAGLQPEEKCALLKGLQPEHKVAMLGDGINDLLTLVAADVGIAIGYAAEMNLESADIVITRNRITHLLKAIYISRLMMINVRRSLMWVGLYNVLAISLAVAGILTPVFSGIAMSVSSMIVVLNADRLKKDCAHISFEKIERLRMSRPLFRAGNTRGSRADSRAV